MTPSNSISQHHSMSGHPIDSHNEPTITISDTFIDSTNRITADDGSDYGDFGNDEEELEIVEQLLQQAVANASKVDENEPLVVIDIEDYEAPRGVRLPKVLGLESTRLWETTPTQSNTQALRDFARTIPEKKDAAKDHHARAESPPPEPETLVGVPDTRSPLERFRRPPKKALSVTDLVSPAWCELQYFYTLSKHGRKKRTPAMKQGTQVHQTLEAEIHITVPIEVPTKEDSWGLRIWNIIQGLRTLRDMGRTREIEIWGTVGGEVVNGIIDELSYECPDPKLEEQLNKKDGNRNTGPELPEYQTSITEFFQTGAQKENGQSISAALSTSSSNGPTIKRQQGDKGIYITDVKTRGSNSLPSGPSMRPTILQLHLYHHMLENLAQGNFSLIQLANRYNLDITSTFSDSFIAQIGNLNHEIFDFASSQDEPLPTQLVSSQDSMDILLRHNNLSTLWDFMLLQFRDTFLLPHPSAIQLNETPTPTPQSTSDLPSPSSQPTRLSPLLTAEYITSTYKHVPGTDKKFLGRKSFVFNPDFLRRYLEDNLSWWRGERSARGVELQEAWKCRSCDFRDDCEWIHERDRAAVEEVEGRKLRRRMREIAGVEGEGKSKV